MKRLISEIKTAITGEPVAAGLYYSYPLNIEYRDPGGVKQTRLEFTEFLDVMFPALKYSIHSPQGMVIIDQESMESVGATLYWDKFKGGIHLITFTQFLLQFVTISQILKYLNSFKDDKEIKTATLAGIDTSGPAKHGASKSGPVSDTSDI